MKTIYQEIVEMGHEWANLNAAAELLEESRKSILSHLMQGYEGSNAARETGALQDDNYREHIKEMVEARRRANIAKVNYEAIKIKSEMWRTQQANERASLRESP